jgi:hypothetical protein
MDSMEHSPLFGGILVALLLLVPLWKIFGKAGFAPAWALLIFVPGVGGLAILLLLAFRRWPATEGNTQPPI